MIIVALAMQINNEIEDVKQNKSSIEVTNQIGDFFDNYLANESVEQIKRLDINGTAYIGILTIPSLNNMSLRSN